VLRLDGALDFAPWQLSEYALRSIQSGVKPPHSKAASPQADVGGQAFFKTLPLALPTNTNFPDEPVFPPVVSQPSPLSLQEESPGEFENSIQWNIHFVPEGWQESGGVMFMPSETLELETPTPAGIDDFGAEPTFEAPAAVEETPLLPPAVLAGNDPAVDFPQGFSVGEMHGPEWRPVDPPMLGPQQEFPRFVPGEEVGVE
jgi:hypothetical protein